MSYNRVVCVEYRDSSFIYNEPSTTEIYTYCHTLSLHDARPIFHVESFAQAPPRATEGRPATEIDIGRRRKCRQKTQWMFQDIGTRRHPPGRSEEHTSELQSLMRTSYAVFCLKKKKNTTHSNHSNINQPSHNMTPLSHQSQ